MTERKYFANNEFINTKVRVWIDDNTTWDYLFINKNDGKVYVKVENHYYEKLEDHKIREFEKKPFTETTEIIKV